MTTELAFPDPTDRQDLRTLLRKVLRTDEAAPVRISAADPGFVRVWMQTPFGAIVSRVVAGRCSGDDTVLGADHLLTELDVLDREDHEGAIDPGLTLLSAWHGALPPATGFTEVERVPAQVILDLAESGRQVAHESSGPLGLPPSLLDSVALRVGTDTDTPVGVDMRAIFAITTCDLVPNTRGKAPDGEPVRISTLGQWVRIDARFGTVHRRPETFDLGVV